MKPSRKDHVLVREFFGWFWCLGGAIQRGFEGRVFTFEGLGVAPLGVVVD